MFRLEVWNGTWHPWCDPKISLTPRSHSRRTWRFPAPLQLSLFSPPDGDRSVDSPALFGRGSQTSWRTSGWGQSHEGSRDVASWVVPHAERPRFPGPLLIRSRCPVTSLKVTLWMKAQNEGALTPLCIVPQNRRFHIQLDRWPVIPWTTREASGVPLLHTRRGLTLLSQLCRDPAIRVRNGEEPWRYCLNPRLGPLQLHQSLWCPEKPLSTPQYPWLLRGTPLSSLRSWAQVEGTQGFLPHPEKDLESSSSKHLEAWFPYHDSRAMRSSPTPRPWRPDFRGTTGVSLSSPSYLVRNPNQALHLEKTHETPPSSRPIVWPPHVKSWLIGKDSAAGRGWGQEEKGTTEDKMAGWHHRLNGREFEWTPGVGDGQGGLACWNSWGCKESDTTERLNWTELISFVWSNLIYNKISYLLSIHWRGNVKLLFCLVGKRHSLGTDNRDNLSPDA